MEAMSLGDRIAIVNKGKIVQIGTSDEIYYMPCNEFVAQLMGDPEINIVGGRLEKTGAGYAFSLNDVEGRTYQLPEDKDLFAALDEAGLTDVELGIRPQNVKYSFDPVEDYTKCTVYSYESIGNKSVIVAEIGNLQLRMIAPNGLAVKIDQDIYVKLELDHAIFFNMETKEYVSRYNEAAVKALAAEQEG